MKRVQENLLSCFDTTKIKEIVKNEQELLDTMATQVQQNVNSDDKNILEIAGLEMKPVTKTEEKIILKKLGNNKGQYVRAFRVVNKKTQEKFDKCLNESDNKETDLLWHGSRTENWWSILSTGLMIRPSGAVYTGSMFGDALYFATKAQKSIGYTSLSSSYWAKGNDSKAYLALFEVNTGKQKHIYEHDSTCYSLCYDKIKKQGYDSVFAHAGKSLKNDEIMAYRSEQCTVKYIVEISK
jgi:poly [ADP-ribose] polymerase